MMHLSSWDWNEAWMNAICIGCGIREFFSVITLGLIAQIFADVCLRGRELQTVRLAQIRKHWRLAVITVIVFLFTCAWLPWVNAETIIERRDVNGKTTSIEVQRTAHEQELAKYQYIKPDGSIMYYMSDDNKPVTREAFEADFQKKIERTMNFNNKILSDAHQAVAGGMMSPKEYREHQSRLNVANGNLTSWVKSIHDENAKDKFQPDAVSTPERRIRIVEKPRVLVSGD